MCTARNFENKTCVHQGGDYLLSYLELHDRKVVGEWKTLLKKNNVHHTEFPSGQNLICN